MPGRSPPTAKNRKSKGAEQIFRQPACGRREIDRFQASPCQNGSRRLENPGQSRIFCTPFSQNRAGFGSPTPTDSTTRHDAQRTNADRSSGTENQKYHPTFSDTIPVSKRTEKVVNTGQIPVNCKHWRRARDEPVANSMFVNVFRVRAEILFLSCPEISPSDLHPCGACGGR